MESKQVYGIFVLIAIVIGIVIVGFVSYQHQGFEIAEVYLDPENPIADQPFNIVAKIYGVPVDGHVYCKYEMRDNESNIRSSGWGLMIGTGNTFTSSYYLNDHDSGMVFHYQIVVLDREVTPNDGTAPLFESDWYLYNIP